METMIKSLNELGLTRYEAMAYIGLTKIITGHASEIAESSNLPRSRIYDILNELEKKGFVTIQRGKPITYTVVQPSQIFKQKKEKMLKKLDETENKLEEIYTNEISEVPAPVWLIHKTDNILKKEKSIIKKASKTLTIRIGFLLENEAKEMIKAFNNIPRNVKIRIIANEFCCINHEKINIIKEFEKSKLDNLEIVKADLPLIKILIRDEKELFGTFVRFDHETDSILPETAIGVCNQYEDLCKNFNEHFMRHFQMLKKIQK